MRVRGALTTRAAEKVRHLSTGIAKGVERQQWWQHADCTHKPFQQSTHLKPLAAIVDGVGDWRLDHAECYRLRQSPFAVCHPCRFGRCS